MVPAIIASLVEVTVTLAVAASLVEVTGTLVVAASLVVPLVAVALALPAQREHKPNVN